MRFPLRPTRRLLACCIAALYPLFSDGVEPNTPLPSRASDGTVELQLGMRLVHTSKRTASGVPVVPMWAVPMSNKGGSDFPLAKDAEHYAVWAAAERSDGGYNHFAALTCHEDRLYAMWANHWFGEYGPGQRALIATSSDGGKTWNNAAPLFPPPGKIARSGETGIYLTPDRWVSVGGKLYAVANVVSEETNYLIARRIEESGALGPVFLVRDMPDRAELPVFMAGLTDRKATSPEAGAIRQWYADNGVASWWGAGLPRTAVDEAHMIEPVRYRSKDGVSILLQRSMPISKKDPPNNHRLYVSFGDGAGGWSVPQPTDIPDAPSRSEVIVLKNGITLLIGNHMAPQLDVLGGYLPRDPLTVALSNDGYSFDRVFAARAGAPRKPRFAELRKRCPGFGYPSSVIFHGYLCILYSVGKEDMALTRIPLSSLGISL